MFKRRDRPPKSLLQQMESAYAAMCYYARSAGKPLPPVSALLQQLRHKSRVRK